MRFPKTILTAIAGTVLSVAPCFAQEAKISPPVLSPRVTAAQTMMLSDLTKWEIVLQNGEPVGQIVDFVIGTQGDVLFAIGTLNNQNYVMPYSAMVLDAKGRMVQLAATPEQFDQLSFFKGRSFPDFSSPPFRQEMTRIYGDRIFNSATSPRGRGNLGANQTDGRDTLNPAGKAPPGLNREEGNNGNLPIDQNRTNGAIDNAIGKTAAEILEARRREGLSPRAASKSATDPNRKRESGDFPRGTGRDIQKPVDQTPGVNPNSPRNPGGNSGLPGRPSGTPNYPIPNPAKIPEVKPQVPSGTPNTPLPKTGPGAGVTPPSTQGGSGSN